MNEETKNTLDYINEFMNAPLEQIYLNRKRIKLVLNYITDLQQENARLKDKIEKVIEYVNHYESIKGYYEYEECGYDEYNYEEDLKEELLELLKEN